MNVEIAPLPVWTGGLIAAEYDAELDCIRVSSVALARLRALLGDAAAEAFVRCAVAHERFHRDHPRATEVQAHEHVRVTCGEDPRRFDAALRL